MGDVIPLLPARIIPLLYASFSLEFITHINTVS